MTYLYTYMINVIDFHIQKDRQEFLVFQKMNYTKWNEIDVFLKAVEDFCELYKINYCSLNLQKGLDLIQIQGKKKDAQIELYKPHDILDCLENSEEISSKNQNKKGIRFYGNKGKIRAIVKIQASWRGKLGFEKAKKIKEMIRKITIIQRSYRLHRQFLNTKTLISQKCTKMIKDFHIRQK